MLTLIAFSFLIMLVSLVGVGTVWSRAGNFIRHNLNFLVSFSGGVFLVIAYQLTEETLEHAAKASVGYAWIGIGALGVLLLFKILPSFHHHHNEAEEHTHSRIDARRILLSDGIHNIGDGILLAASFAVSQTVGITAAISIFVHELVQEISEFFVLQQAGLSIRKALLLNFAVSATILIGSLGGFFLLEKFETFEAPLLGFSAGSFFVVVIHDLIPHSVRTSKGKRHYVKHIIWFLVGIILMAWVNTLTSH